MADAYLNAAEKVLSSVRQPLNARAIIQLAYARDLLPWHLRGARQDRTLQARLSVDISRSQENSAFYRTAPGAFFLRKFLVDSSIPTQYKNVFTARPRRIDLAKERVLALKINVNDIVRSDGVTVPVSRIADIFSRGEYIYENHQNVVYNSDLVAVHSFVIVHRDNDVLSFRYGSHIPIVDPLYGTRSIGLGSAVTAENLDILSDSFFGIASNGINELIYGVGLPRKFAWSARYEGKLKPCLGVMAKIHKRASPVLHLVMSYECPDTFVPTKAALSINDLRWIDAANPANSLADFDETSAFLFAQDYVRDIVRLHRT